MRLAPPALVVAAAFAHIEGSGRAAWYLLLLAIPVTFTTALRLFGSFVEGESDAADVDLMRLALLGCALGFVLLAAVSTRIVVATCAASTVAFALEATLAAAPPPLLVVLRGR